MNATLGNAVKSFFFCFGYESPDEWVANTRDGTDFESSNGVWVEAPSQQDAVEAGLEFAQSWVAKRYCDAQVDGIPGWRESNYAYWIEDQPLEKWSGVALDTMLRIQSKSLGAT